MLVRRICARAQSPGTLELHDLEGKTAARWCAGGAGVIRSALEWAEDFQFWRTNRGSTQKSLRPNQELIRSSWAGVLWRDQECARVEHIWGTLFRSHSMI